LNCPEFRNDVADSDGEFLNRLSAFARAITQVFTQQQLRLAQNSCKRIVDFVANARDKFRYIV